MPMGELIRYYRKQRHMSQDELAEMIGSTKQTISKYEHNIIPNMKRSTVLAISDALGVDAAILMGLDIEEIDRTERIRDKIRLKPTLGDLLELADKLSEDELNAVIRIVRSMQ